MNRIIFNLLALVLILGNSCHAQALVGATLGVSKRDCKSVLQEVVPDEFKYYKALSSKGYDRKTAESALALVSNTCATRAQHRDDKSLSEHKHTRLDYSVMFAWEIVIQTWKKTTDESAKAEMLSAWNSSLKDEPDVRFLINALEDEWDRAFVTEPFVELFKKTKDSALFTPFCQVFGQYGEYAEEKLLNEKFYFVMNVLIPGTPVYDVALSNIESALKKIDYWKKGDPTRSGPASRCTEFPFDLLNFEGVQKQLIPGSFMRPSHW